MKKIAIIGGGASGLMAAYFASRNHRVVLFEKQKKIGRKVLVTGNGRCNLSNRFIDISKYHGRNPKFVLNVFSRFGPDDTIDFFSSIGLPVVEKENGRLYPASLQAASVVRMLEYELVRAGVDIQLHRKIEKIIPGANGVRLVTAGKESFFFDSAVLAAGSCAYAAAGASNSGYELAASAGHTVHEPFPSILPLTIPLKALHRLEGIKWDCGAAVSLNGKSAAETAGELLFTKFGISGPAALDISRSANEAVIAGGKPEIVLDLFPEFSEEDLRQRLESLWGDGNRTAAFSLGGIMKERMPDVLLPLAGIDANKKVADLSSEEKEKILKTLKGLRLEPGRPRPFSEAVVAAGGVDVDEINPATMGSRLVPRLHITGELLDIDGDSGGYNLQFAWSTGAVAGMSV